MYSKWLATAVLLLAVSVSAKPEDWAPQTEEHWASAQCTELTTALAHYANHNEGCHTCVTATKGHGDPTRCHACLRTHQGHHHKPDELVTACMECVPKMEHKRLGWACTQYCTHHGIINDRKQVWDCVDCLDSDQPTDKWACHVCMEQVDFDMEARDDCYQCLKRGEEMYSCAWCGRVPDKQQRAECFECMKKGEKGKACAEVYGLKPWSKPAKTPM